MRRAAGRLCRLFCWLRMFCRLCWRHGDGRTCTCGFQVDGPGQHLGPGPRCQPLVGVDRGVLRRDADAACMQSELCKTRL